MGGGLNSGDTAWLLGCCSLVLMMTPALAFALVIGSRKGLGKPQLEPVVPRG